MKLCLILLVALTGCVGEVDCVELYNVEGINFCFQWDNDGNFNEAVVAPIIQILEEEAQVYYPEVVDLAEKVEVSNITVILKNKTLVGDCEPSEVPGITQCESHIGGFYYQNYIQDPYILIATYSGPICLGRYGNTFVHEMLHFIEFNYLGLLGESDHTIPYLFRINYDTNDRIRETVEYKAEGRAMKLCEGWDGE